jgi:hypothetical protein
MKNHYLKLYALLLGAVTLAIVLPLAKATPPAWVTVAAVSLAGGYATLLGYRLTFGRASRLSMLSTRSAWLSHHQIDDRETAHEIAAVLPQLRGEDPYVVTQRTAHWRALKRIHRRGKKARRELVAIAEEMAALQPRAWYVLEH